METVINEHGLDIDALKSSRGPLTGGTHMGDSSSAPFAGKYIPTQLLLLVAYLSVHRDVVV